MKKPENFIQKTIGGKPFRFPGILLLCVCLLSHAVTAKDEKKLYLSKIYIFKGVPAR